MHHYRIIVAYRQLEGKEEYRVFGMAGDSFSEIYSTIEAQVVPGRRIVAVVRDRMVTL